MKQGNYENNAVEKKYKGKKQREVVNMIMQIIKKEERLPKQLKKKKLVRKIWLMN